jgi:hypothetical protein
MRVLLFSWHRSTELGRVTDRFHQDVDDSRCLRDRRGNRLYPGPGLWHFVLVLFDTHTVIIGMLSPRHIVKAAGIAGTASFR